MCARKSLELASHDTNDEYYSGGWNLGLRTLSSIIKVTFLRLFQLLPPPFVTATGRFLCMHTNVVVSYFIHALHTVLRTCVHCTIIVIPSRILPTHINMCIYKYLFILCIHIYLYVFVLQQSFGLLSTARSLWRHPLSVPDGVYCKTGSVIIVRSIRENGRRIHVLLIPVVLSSTITTFVRSFKTTESIFVDRVSSNAVR